MAGIPLKSGADFYNLEASRMRLHNLGADPTEFGLGQIYYNSSSGNNTSGRARLYTGTGFRSLAFMDDIAAIQEQLDLLTGEVDTSELISNLEDVLNFLNNIKENDGDLMTMLNGKFDKTGGTISGFLHVGDLSNTSPVAFYVHNNSHGVRISGNEKTGYIAFGANKSDGDITAEKIIKIGDDGLLYTKDGGASYHTILTSAGGTIDGDIKINSIDGTPALIYFSVANSGRGALGCVAAGPVYYDVNYNGHDLLHSGNIGEYAALISDDIFAEGQPSNALGYSYSTSSGLAQAGPTMVFGKHNYRAYLYGRDGALKFNTVENGTLTGWKTIAFTDSDITGNAASASKIVDNNYNYIFHYGDSAVYLNYGSLSTRSTKIYGKTIDFISGASATTAMLINSSGNVTIGGSDLAGTANRKPKLYVDGHLTCSTEIRGNIFYFTSGGEDKGWFGSPNNAGGSDFVLAVNEGNVRFDTNSKEIMRITDGGKVLIGTITDDNSGAKLQVKGYARALAFLTNGDSGIWKGNVFGGTGNTADSIVIYGDRINHRADTYINGDLHVTGNIIADKEVSAGGAAEESGEGGGGTGGGDASIYSQTFTPSTTSVPITHGLSAEKGVIVQVYEKVTIGSNIRWDLVLVDVEIVDSQNIILNFGRTEATEHMVVVMG